MATGQGQPAVAGRTLARPVGVDLAFVFWVIHIEVLAQPILGWKRPSSAPSDSVLERWEQLPGWLTARRRGDQRGRPEGARGMFTAVSGIFLFLEMDIPVRPPVEDPSSIKGPMKI